MGFIEYASFLDYFKHVMASETTFWLNNGAPWTILKNSLVTRQRGAEKRGFKTVSTYMKAY